MAALFLSPTEAIGKKKQPVFVDPGFDFHDVDTLYVLPSVDLRVAKDKDPDKHLQQLDCAVVKYLKRWRHYHTVPEQVKCKESNPPTRLTVTEDDLKEPEESWVKKLGP